MHTPPHARLLLLALLGAAGLCGCNEYTVRPYTTPDLSKHEVCADGVAFHIDTDPNYTLIGHLGSSGEMAFPEWGEGLKDLLNNVGCGNTNASSPRLSVKFESVRVQGGHGIGWIVPPQVLLIFPAILHATYDMDYAMTATASLKLTDTQGRTLWRAKVSHQERYEAEMGAKVARPAEIMRSELNVKILDTIAALNAELLKADP